MYGYFLVMLHVAIVLFSSRMLVMDPDIDLKNNISFSFIIALCHTLNNSF